MTANAAALRAQTRLRRAAERLLAEGQAPPTRGWELGTDALALLYRLANNFESSHDALAVLHELQVHQVELDLQLEQLEMNEEQLTEESRVYRERYEHAPVGYLTISPEGRIIEANETAKQMVASLAGDAIRGDHSIVDLIRPEDRPTLTAMLLRLDADHAIESCDVRAIDAAADAPALRITARLEPNSFNAWVIISR